jgi:enhancing lycopene biosynthesis protein 2
MKVGVLLSGCGVQDGSEVYESVLTILAIQRAGAQVAVMAPDVPQRVIINHYSGSEERYGEGGGPRRDVLAEAARIVRGKITSVNEVSAHDMDALIIPGGFGVVQNLCTYGTDGLKASVNDQVRRLVTEMATLRKPIGAICIAPVLIALCLPEKAPKLTIGTDGKTTLDLQRLGAEAVESGVTDIVVDERLNIVSTPAFMLAQSALEAEAGINKLVQKVIELAKAM